MLALLWMWVQSTIQPPSRLTSGWQSRNPCRPQFLTLSNVLPQWGPTSVHKLHALFSSDLTWHLYHLRRQQKSFSFTCLPSCATSSTPTDFNGGHKYFLTHYSDCILSNGIPWRKPLNTVKTVPPGVVQLGGLDLYTVGNFRSESN